jgi:IS5 family transposase
MRQPGLFGLSEHLERLSKDGDPLEVLEATVDFEYFRCWLVEGLGYGDGSKGGRPPFDPVSMFKALILQAQHNLSDARMEFMIRDRLSWMRFLSFDLGGSTPDENTIRHFRNRLTETGTLKRVMKAFDWQLQKKGYIPMSGQIIDASLVPAPKQRNTEEEKAAIKDGKSATEIWPDAPNKAAQKDTDARWTLKIGGKVRHRPDGAPLPMIAIPTFGYKTHVSIDRRFGFIRQAMATGKPMSRATARANARKSSIRAVVEHVFAHQKNKFGLFIRTIGLARAEAKLTLANLAYNMNRLIFHERRNAMG